MNSINGVGSQSPIQKVIASPVFKTVGADQPQTTGRAADRVELSGLGELLKTLKTNDIRMEKVSQVKAAITAGTYEDDKKMDVAVDRLLDDLNG